MDEIFLHIRGKEKWHLRFIPMPESEVVSPSPPSSYPWPKCDDMNLLSLCLHFLSPTLEHSNMQVQYMSLPWVHALKASCTAQYILYIVGRVYNYM